MSMMSLDQRLAHQSAKFLKACNQMKLIKCRLAEQIRLFTHLTPEDTERNITYKESIRQQIEILQCIKTVYTIYAHEKADEINQLQCELYGEDAVRAAYQQTAAVQNDEQHQQSHQNSDFIANGGNINEQNQFDPTNENRNLTHSTNNNSNANNFEMANLNMIHANTI